MDNVLKQCLTRTLSMFETQGKLHLLWQLLLGLLCAIGFVIQSTQVTFRYFSYQTNVFTTLNIEKLVPAPSLSLCSPYYPLIDEQKLYNSLNTTDKQEFNISIKQDFVYEAFLNRKLTLRQMFELTPRIKFNQCRLKFPGDFNTDTYNASKCYELFIIDKMVSQDNICYKFKFNGSGLYHFSATMKTMYFPGMLYQLILIRDFLNKSTQLTPTLHPQPDYGESSRLYASAYVPVLNNVLNHCRVTYSRYRSELLPFPYDTKCHPNTDYSWEICQRECILAKTLEVHGTLPFSVTYYESDLFKKHANANMVDPQSMRNDTFKGNFVQTAINCSLKCPNDCFREWYVTDVVNMAYFDFLKGVSFRVDLPRTPYVEMVYKPYIIFNDYVIHVLSCLGAWLGVSIIQLNPFRFLKQRHTRIAIGNQLTSNVLTPVNIHKLASDVQMLKRYWMVNKVTNRHLNRT